MSPKRRPASRTARESELRSRACGRTGARARVSRRQSDAVRRRRIALIGVAVASVVAVLLVVPAMSRAASTVAYVPGALEVVASPGIDNAVTVTTGVGTITIADTADTLDSTGACVGDGTNSLVCDSTLITVLDVDLQNGNDTFTAAASTMPVSVQGGAGFDVINGSSQADDLLGGADDDTLRGKGGGDTLDGGNGNDIYDEEFGSNGADVLADTGDGLDTARYLGRSIALAVSLDGAANDGQSGEGDDVGPGIDIIQGGTQDDVLSGGPNADTISGGSGNDTIDGGGGDDTESGGGGDDTYQQGASANGADTFIEVSGSDMVTYELRSAGVVVTADGLAADDGEPGENDSVVSQIEIIRGGSGPDDLTGGNGANELEGEGGGDTLDGSLGADTLRGGAGDDTFEVIDAPDGADRYEGGADTDTMSWAASTTGVTVSLDNLTNDGRTLAAEGDDVRSDIEVLVGTDAIDDLAGGVEDDRLVGSAGTDTLSGGDGADVFVASSTADGDDDVDGGSGTDEVDYSARSASVSIDLGAGTAGEGAEADTLTSIEAARGGSDDDVIAGSTGDDVLWGGFGADSITDLAGADTVDGGDGDDTFETGAVADAGDVYRGGPGSDLVSYAARTSGVTVDLGSTTLDDGEPLEGDDVDTSVEEVAGGSADDVLIGTADAESLTGNGGGDQVTGGGGADQLDGGAGADTYEQGPATTLGETITDASGSDTVSYADRTGDVAASIDGAANDGEVGEADDIPAGIEQLSGGDGDDTISGGAGDEFLIGGEGDDTFPQGSSDDGADVMIGDAGTDVVDYSLRSSPVVVTKDTVANDGEAGEQDSVQTDVDTIVGGAGADALTGAGGPETLIGGPGDDLLDGALGADVLNGGSGNDTVTYELRTAPLAADLDAAIGDDGVSGEGDSLGADIERLLGGSGNDLLGGGGITNEIIGGAGNDTISGRGGNDTVNGGAGNDTLVADAGLDGVDVLVGGTGVDTASYASRGVRVVLTINGAADDGSAGEGDTIRTDVETLRGGSAGDSLTGSSATNRIEGGFGNDTIIGGGGADTLFGDAGADVVNGGSGNDLLTGGSGRDRLIGGAGRDVLDGRDRARGDRLECGSSRDTARYNRGDVLRSCEVTRRFR